jgi:hypothetical protein
LNCEPTNPNSSCWGDFVKKVIKSGRLKGVRRKAVVRFKERITPDLEKESYSKTQT